MVQINRPTETKNPFKDVVINRSAAPAQAGGRRGDVPVGDSLNKMAGNKIEDQYVDRASKETLGQDGFMKLLAHQLRNQDPMKPMDQKDFSANLAQFSQLEQLTAMNKKMEAVNQNALDDKRVQGASFLGRKVVTNGTSLDYKGNGASANLPFYLDKPARHAIVNVVDDKNQLVARVEAENLGRGMQDITWNGMDFNGQYAAPETYRFEVIAFDENNEKFLGETKSDGIVQGVTFEEGETILSLSNGKKVFLKDVESFSLPEPVQAPGGSAAATQKQAAQMYNQVVNQ